MKKLFSLFILFVLALALVSCGGNDTPGGEGNNGDGGHIHQYTEKLTYAPGAEIIAPTCTSGGKYYYVCTCGKPGTETYETAPNPHSFSRMVEDEEHLAKEASCQDAKRYFYTCENCDAISPDATFSSGSRLEHSYEDNLCVYGCGDELNKYTLSEGGDYYILTLFREKLDIVALPSEYKGLPVKAIGSHAFSGVPVKEIILPESITEIKDNAFYTDTTLEKINLENVTSIGEQAFYGCASLTEVKLNTGVTLGDYCFAATGITELTIPENVTNIGVGAFSHCSSLERINYNAILANDIEYPNSVFSCYEDDAQDITLYISKNVERIPASFFSNSKVADIVIDEECNSLTVGRYAFYQASLPISLTLERVATVGQRAFYGTGITALTLDGHIDLVESEAFGECSALSEVTILKNRGRFEQYLFANCDSLETVYYRHEGSEVLDRALWSSGETLKLVIGSNVKTIPSDFEAGGIAFLEFESGASDVVIGDNAFISDIRGVLDLSCVKAIGSRAFGYTTTGIDKLILPRGLESLGASAFYKVNELEYLAEACRDIPLYDGSIRPAFANVGSVVFGADVKAIPAHIFHTVTIGSVGFADENIYLERIGDYAFGSAKITSLSLPRFSFEIGDYAFYNVITASTINLTKVEELGEYSFAEFKGNIILSGINIPNIPDSAFKGAVGITGELDLSDVGVIGPECFSGCTGITKLIIGEATYLIDDYSFEDCTGLTEVVFNAINALDAPEVSQGAFRTSETAKGFKLTIGNKVTHIPSHLFKSSQVNKIIFEDESVCKSIGEYAFAYTYELYRVNVVLPDSLESLGSSAFVLTKASSITFGSGIKYIGENALWSMGVAEDEGTRDYGFIEKVFFTEDVTFKVYSYDSETDTVTDTGETVTFKANDSENATEYAKLLYRGNLVYSTYTI
ncbi:MAG: leucine-rich repeat protein [Clostridia bacterium]|nr:leucine-rich repeat protein [Clostridia bacterium]